MYDPRITFDEFSKALQLVSQKIDEMSDALNDFAAKVVEAWNNIFPSTFETLGELATVFDKVNRKKPPRPSYRGVRTCEYGYIKTFQRNLPYQRRKY